MTPRIRTSSFACIALAALAGCASQGPSSDATPAPAAVRPVAAPASAAREGRIASLAPDRTEVRYRVRGRGAPAIVFIHGWSCDSSYWDLQVDQFARRHVVITVDLAGHGASPGDLRRDWSIANFGADVAAVVRTAGVEDVVLVGSSMGGPVALEAARRLPGMVRGIVGVDTFRDIAQPYPQEMVEGLIAQMREDFATATAGFVGGNFFTDRTDHALKQWIVDDMSSAPPTVAIPAIIGLTQMDYAAALAELDVPIVALNTVHPPTDETATRRIEPRFSVQTLDGVGHFPMLEDPQAFNAALARIVADWGTP